MTVTTTETHPVEQTTTVTTTAVPTRPMRVIFDAYSWSVPQAFRPGFYDCKTARRGEVIYVTDEEAARGLAAGGLSEDDPVEERLARRAVEQLSEIATDEELAGMNVGDLEGYVVQNPGEVKRVRDIEQARAKPRVTIERLLDSVEAAAAGGATAGPEVPAVTIEGHETEGGTLPGSGEPVGPPAS